MAAKGQLKLYKVIYKNIKSVLPLDMNGYTPHYYALKYNQVEVIRYINQVLCGPILISRKSCL